MKEKEVIDLTKVYKKRENSGIAVISTWFWDAEEKEYEPCLVVIRADMTGKPCIIPMSSAYAYDDPKNGHRHLLGMARLFNSSLGRADTMNDVHKIADLIHGSLFDLIMMPPRPEELSKAVADAFIRSEDGRERHAVIME